MNGREMATSTSTKLLLEALKDIDLPPIFDNYKAHIDFFDELLKSLAELKSQIAIKVAAEHKWIITQRENYESAHGNNKADPGLEKIREDETDFLECILAIKPSLAKLEKNVSEAKQKMTGKIEIMEIIGGLQPLDKDDASSEPTHTPRLG